MPRYRNRNTQSALVRHAKDFAEARMTIRPGLKRAEALEWTAQELGFPNWNLLTAYAANHPHPAISGTGPQAPLPPLVPRGHTVLVMFSPDHFAAKVLARLRVGPVDRVVVLPEVSEGNAEHHFARLREDRKYEIRLVCPVPLSYLEDPRSGGLVWGRFWDAAEDLCAFAEDGLSTLTSDGLFHSAVLLSLPGKRTPLLQEPIPRRVGPQRPFVSAPHATPASSPLAGRSDATRRR